MTPKLKCSRDGIGKSARCRHRASIVHGSVLACCVKAVEIFLHWQRNIFNRGEIKQSLIDVDLTMILLPDRDPIIDTVFVVVGRGVITEHVVTTR